MAKIFYGLCGEGRGHATRVHAIVEGLRKDHEVVIHASGAAYSFLQPIYMGTEVDVRHLPGLELHYNSMRRLKYLKTGYHWGLFLSELPDLMAEVAASIDREQPDLAITDLEPIVPRAAERCGLPYLSIDHQHFIVVGDLSELSTEIKLHVAFLTQVLNWFYTGQEETVVSSFYRTKIRPDAGKVRQVGTLLRREVLEATPTEGPHVLAYLRRFGSRHALESLDRCGLPVRVYGLGRQPSRGNLTFCDVDPLSFVDDLASCRALISTAGNQLVGEALYLGKPVLAMPEEGNYEQHINAHYLEESGSGTTVPYELITPSAVRGFLDRLGDFELRWDRRQLVGNADVQAIIEEHLHRDDLVRPHRPSFFGERLSQLLEARV
jgi:uncharacterized protein (TIGR00661 family)